MKEAYICDMGNSASAALLEKIRSEDREFVDDLRSIVLRIAHKWNWTDRESVDDIAQDCLLKIISNLQAGKFAGRSTLKTYVYTIVRRTCIDHYRSAKVVETTDVDKVTLIDPGQSPDEILMTKDTRRVAARVLMTLPADCRRLWRTIFFGKRNYRQAAEHLGLKEGTIKRRMWECRRLAREKVAAYEK
jgi:RNA polymerase sigma-70 factor (ECF subfamily)